MEKKINILGIKINNIKMGEAKLKINELMESNNFMNLILTPNPEIVVIAQNDPQLAQILNQADLAVPDGTGIVLASYLLKPVIGERVAGFDLMKQLFDLAVVKEYRVFFLGGKAGVAAKAQVNVLKEYPGIKICGSHHGYLDKKLEKKVINKINNLAPDILFVGMGVPLQEKFLAKNKGLLKVKLAMTVGGAFDVLAGNIKRAPLFLQKVHLEWLYRIIQEPKRIPRVLALPKFVFLVIKEYIGGKFKG